MRRHAEAAPLRFRNGTAGCRRGRRRRLHGAAPRWGDPEPFRTADARLCAPAVCCRRGSAAAQSAREFKHLHYSTFRSMCQRRGGVNISEKPKTGKFYWSRMANNEKMRFFCAAWHVEIFRLVLVKMHNMKLSRKQNCSAAKITGGKFYLLIREKRRKNG